MTYHYQQKDFNSYPKPNKLLIATALILFIAGYLLAGTNDFNTLQAENEFYNQNK